jgi:hypothetical protein
VTACDVVDVLPTARRALVCNNLKKKEEKKGRREEGREIQKVEMRGRENERA